MFFRSTLIAHKTARKPYFMGLVVHKEIILFHWKALFYKGFRELHLENDVYLMFNR